MTAKKRPRIAYPFTAEVRASLLAAVRTRLRLHVAEARVARQASDSYNTGNDPDGRIRSRLLAHRRRLGVYTRTLLCLSAWLRGIEYREVERRSRCVRRLALRMSQVLQPLLTSRGVENCYAVLVAWVPKTEAEKDVQP